MSCDCAKYQPIELDRKSITRRINQSPAIRKRLTQIAEHPGFTSFAVRNAVSFGKAVTSGTLQIESISFWCLQSKLPTGSASRIANLRP